MKSSYSNIHVDHTGWLAEEFVIITNSFIVYFNFIFNNNVVICYYCVIFPCLIGAVAYPGGRFTGATGPIFITNVSCSGMESGLYSCEYSILTDADGCTHSNDAGLTCRAECK